MVPTMLLLVALGVSGVAAWSAADVGASVDGTSVPAAPDAQDPEEVEEALPQVHVPAERRSEWTVSDIKRRARGLDEAPPTRPPQG